jgi:hypothetical protein
VGAPPASQHATAESAATLNWLAKTNLMWTSNDFSPLDQVTTGAARTAYLAQERATTSAPAPGSRTPFQLTSLSITVPCHQGAEAVFVAYGDTEPFSTWLCLADLQGVDGLGELAGAPGAAAELAEDAPGFELRVCPLGGCAEFRVGPVGLVVEWEVPDASERNTPPQVSYYEPAIVDGALLMEFTSRTESSKPKGCSFKFNFTLETPQWSARVV